MTEAVDHVLFDLDGTLVDTAPDMARALNIVLSETGRSPLPFETLRPHVSHGSTGLLDIAYGKRQPSGERERLRTRFLDVYYRDLARESRPFPGVEPLLAELDDAGIGWGVVTNKPGWLAQPLLRILGLDIRSACLIAGDTLDRRKPDPAPLLFACERIGASPERTIYVGDAERDVQAGRAAGIRTLVALFGYLGTDDAPEFWGADGLIAAPADIWDHLGVDRDSAEAS